MPKSSRLFRKGNKQTKPKIKAGKKTGSVSLKKPVKSIAHAGKTGQGKRVTQNSFNGLSNHVIPQPIDDNSIDQMAAKNKFPYVGPTVKPKPNIDGNGMVVAILDTGVFEHDDLKGKIIKRINYTGATDTVEDHQGHGTHIAGIIAGSQSKRFKYIKGIAPGARIVSVKITVGNDEETSLWRIADGLERIKEHNQKAKQTEKVTAIVVCFNAFDNVERYVVTQHHRLAQLIKEFYDQNIPFICSGGNNYDKFLNPQGENLRGLAYPAYIQHVITCAATYNVPPDNEKSDKKFGEYTEFAQRIEPVNKVFNNYFLPAPGYETVSAGIKSKTSYSTISGSSQAAAVIAGTILLIQQQSFLINKKMPTVNQLIDLLKNQNK